MSITEIRQEVHKYIDETDEDMLKDIFSFIKSFSQKAADEEGYYTTKGEKLTREQVIQIAAEASERVKSGNFVSQGDVEKLVKSW
jgi:hypothetical protein